MIDDRQANWADAGVGEQVLRTALAGYDQMLGWDRDDPSVDGSITKSPCGGAPPGAQGRMISESGARGALVHLWHHCWRSPARQR